MSEKCLACTLLLILYNLFLEKNNNKKPSYFSLSPAECVDPGELWGLISSGIWGIPEREFPVTGMGRPLFLGLPGLYCT